MRKLPSPWSIIWTDHACCGITTSAPVSEGTRISVLVDPVNPKRAIPLALYADPGAAQSGERPISAEQQSWLQKLKARGLKQLGASQTVPGDDR